MALGFAAYLLFLKSTETDGGKYYGSFQNEKYLINDESAAYFYKLWQQHTPDQVVTQALQNTELWGIDLAALPGFAAAVQKYLLQLMSKRVVSVITMIEPKKVSA
jgi:tagaturonate reductase